MGQILPSDEFMMIFFMMIVSMMMAVMLMFIMMMMMIVWRAALQHWGRELRGKLKTALEAALQAQARTCFDDDGDDGDDGDGDDEDNKLNTVFELTHHGMATTVMRER